MKLASLIQWGTPKPENYRGILMRANPTLHQEAFDLLQSYAKKDGRVIDLGSGQGAFAARLSDNGFAVTSVDKNPDDFKAENVEFVAVDFDDSDQVDAFRRQHAALYDVAVGMEVIEHVENPWEYFRFLLSLVRPGGVVLLTTPNAGSAYSRVDFLFSGLFSHFTEQDFQESGHINPLTIHELDIIVRSTGAKILVSHAICELPLFVVSRRISSVLKSVIGTVVRIFANKYAKGDIICLIVQKAI
jgi:2-polyprenyl-3-methyl-5-hydroxy-6-metoxy-1,4-benzoquinol methylase